MATPETVQQIASGTLGALKRQIASDVMRALAGACEEIVIAGGIRRGKPDPHDVELVLLPRGGCDLFGEESDGESAELLHAIKQLLAVPGVAMDPHVKRDGPRYKRLLVRRVPVELFIASRVNFGNIVAIRTGDSDFSRLLVTPRRHGGLMPEGMRQTGGRLLRGSELVACRTEGDFFRALGIDEPPSPQYRCLSEARRLARGGAS